MKKRTVFKNIIVSALCCGMLTGCGAAANQEAAGVDWRTVYSFIDDTYNHGEEVKVCVAVFDDGLNIYLNQEEQVAYSKLMFPYVSGDPAATIESYASGLYNDDEYTDISVDLVKEDGTKENIQWYWSADTASFVPSGEFVAAVVEEEPQAPEIYLKDVFAEHGMKVGTCLTPSMIASPEGSEFILSHFSSVTCENAMKPDYIFNQKESQSSGELVVEFNSDMVKMLDWAVENDMAVRGHTLVWYSQTPGWIFHENFDMAKPLVSKEVMKERMESYIKQVFEKLDEAGYTKVIYAYDVVNEAWMEDGSVRTDANLWYSTMGEDFLYYAFYYADMYAPESIELYYNDYNEQFKADTLVDFVDTLKDDEGNYLIDGVGLQAHLYTSDNLDEYFAAMDKIAATGLKIQLTELDVSLGAWQKTLIPTDENLRAQGMYYYNLINGIFERVDKGIIESEALTFWGYQDSLSWRKSAYPLLFDSSRNPKYAFYGAVQLREYAGF